MVRLIAARVLAAALAAGAFTAIPAVTPAAAQEQTLSFDIREQPLSGALVEFSRRSGVVVVAPADLLAGKRAPAVRGVFTRDAALGRLLSRSGLEPRRRADGGLTLVASARSAASAPQTADQPEPTPTIVVTGQRLMNFTLAYANALVSDERAMEQLPRWNTRLCPSVAGLGPADTEALVAHLAQRAGQVGLTVELSGCQPNLVIVFAPDSDDVARRIVETRRDLLGYLFTEQTIAADSEALARFANTPRAVRWWHVSRTTMTDGEQLGESEPLRPPTRRLYNVGSTGASMPGDGSESGFDGVEAVRSQGTRVRRDTRIDLNFVLIIVDSRRVASVPQQAVADHVTLAALAQISPQADMSGFDSILNLFADGSEGVRPTAMTIWDLAYLQSLYAARPDAASMRQHTTNVARLMAEQIADQSNGDTP